MTKKANMPELNVVTEYSLSGDTFTDVLHVHDKEVFRHDFQMGKERKFIDKANRVSKVNMSNLKKKFLVFLQFSIHTIHNL